MTGLDLRPLTMGEILDRTFSLYRRHFLLFIGISGIPQILVLAFSIAQIFYTPRTFRAMIVNLGVALAFVVVSLVAYLFSQGGAILAVSDLYLGRPTTIGASLRSVWDDFGSLLGVVILNGMAVMFSLLLLILPGIYVACRLLVCVPSALIEKRGPSESLSRSFALTEGNAGRSFVILLLSVVLAWGAQGLFAWPFAIAATLAKGDPSMARIWATLMQVGSSTAAILVSPILLIATSVFYYDLRIRKEAFDLQFMLDPAGSHPGASSVPSILS